MQTIEAEKDLNFPFVHFHWHVGPTLEVRFSVCVCVEGQSVCVCVRVYYGVCARQSTGHRLWVGASFQRPNEKRCASAASLRNEACHGDG